MSFSVISQKCLLFFGWSKNPCFDNLAPKARTPKNAIEIGVSAKQFSKKKKKKKNGHETAIVGPKKAQIQNSSYFFLPFSSLCKTKSTKICWNFYFIAF